MIEKCVSKAIAQTLSDVKTLRSKTFLVGLDDLLALVLSIHNDTVISYLGAGKGIVIRDMELRERPTYYDELTTATTSNTK